MKKMNESAQEKLMVAHFMHAPAAELTVDVLMVLLRLLSSVWVIITCSAIMVFIRLANVHTVQFNAN